MELSVQRWTLALAVIPLASPLFARFLSLSRILTENSFSEIGSFAGKLGRSESACESSLAFSVGWEASRPLAGDS